MPLPVLVKSPPPIMLPKKTSVPVAMLRVRMVAGSSSTTVSTSPVRPTNWKAPGTSRSDVPALTISTAAFLKVPGSRSTVSPPSKLRLPVKLAELRSAGKAKVVSLVISRIPSPVRLSVPPPINSAVSCASAAASRASSKVAPVVIPTRPRKPALGRLSVSEISVTFKVPSRTSRLSVVRGASKSSVRIPPERKSLSPETLSVPRPNLRSVPSPTMPPSAT